MLVFLGDKTYKIKPLTPKMREKRKSAKGREILGKVWVGLGGLGGAVYR